MRVGLIDVDGHGRKKKWGATVYPNLALCKIASYHKGVGDSVEWYDGMFGGHYDRVYISKVFNFTPDIDSPIDADEVIKGGTGYDIKSCLPQEIDDCQPDLSIYPFVPKDVSYGFLTRGCPNRCKWCVVPVKEGAIHPYWDIDRVANGNRKVVLMDNNILAAGDYAVAQLNKIIDRGYRVDFNQALDARLVTPSFAELLAKVKWLDNRIRFGCDTHGQIEDCEKAISLIDSFGYKGQYFLYTMLHGEFEECYSRIHHWWVRNKAIREAHKGNAIYPYAQPFRDPYRGGKSHNGRRISQDGVTQETSSSPSPSGNMRRERDSVAGDGSIPQWQKDLSHWVNKKQLFDKIDFGDFVPRKGFKCESYIKQFTNE